MQFAEQIPIPALDNAWKRIWPWHLMAFAFYFALFLVFYGRMSGQFTDPDRFFWHQRILSRQLLLVIGIHAVTMIGLHWKIWKYRWKRFFWEPSSPRTLSLMRIITAGGILVHFVFQFPSSYVPLASLPPSARQSLPLIGWLMDVIPISPTIFIAALALGIIFSLFAMVGLWTRFSLLMLIPLTFYLFGVPQFFGKLNHTQYFVWAPIILAFTPCADVWSVDALMRKIRGMRLRTKLSFDYALGLRWFTLTFVGIYFFSGVHKLYDTGLFWALSDNPVNLLRTEWIEQFDQVPFLRVDKFPWLCKVAAVAVILFELSYPLMIFSRKTRKLLAFEVLAFHNLNAYFLKIDFNYLKAAHLMFFEVDTLTNRLKNIRRWQAWAVILLGLIGLGWLAGVSFLIFPAIVAAAVDLSWRAIGLRKRMEFLLRIRKRLPLRRTGFNQNSQNWLRMSFVTGIALISINWTMAVFGINSWPFSAYPSYTFLRDSTIEYGWFIPQTADGKILDINAEAQVIGFRKENILPLAERMVDAWKYAPNEIPAKVEACWLRWRTDVPRLQDAVQAKVVIREFSLDPDTRQKLVKETSLGEMRLKSGEWQYLSDSLIQKLQVPN
jgi:hypothetical protein